MSVTSSNVRKPFLHRPWIRGKLYDQYANQNILHCDAYVLEYSGDKYLWMDWRTGGHTRVALDTWLITPEGLTPIWDAESLFNLGTPTYWTSDNKAWMAPLHQRVLVQVSEAEKLPRWYRVTLQAHYVKLTETDGELGPLNKYVERVKRDKPQPTLASMLARPGVIGKPRGRPRKERRSFGILPDIL